MSDQFSALAKFTTIVADSGDLAQIQKYHPTDATTNPSLLFQVAQDPQYSHLIDDALSEADAKGHLEDKEKVLAVLDSLAVNVGVEITKVIDGLISTEIDARLSFDTEACVAKGREIIAKYKEKGVDKNRILIKLASTWEGLQAGKRLEAEGIHVNMTLLFSLTQAIVAAQCGATLVSPFVGRILDWYVATTGTKSYPPHEDPGVKSVTEIYQYFKGIGSNTVVMGASFRNKGEILELAGCDKLTISPKLLEELKTSQEPLDVKLNAKDYPSGSVEKRELDEKTFRWEMNENAMATEKLAQGIRQFAADTVKLEEIIRKKMKVQGKI